jgi:hypothetical protein
MKRERHDLEKKNLLEIALSCCIFLSVSEQRQSPTACMLMLYVVVL